MPQYKITWMDDDFGILAETSFHAGNLNRALLEAAYTSVHEDLRDGATQVNIEVEPSP